MGVVLTLATIGFFHLPQARAGGHPGRRGQPGRIFAASKMTQTVRQWFDVDAHRYDTVRELRRPERC